MAPASLELRRGSIRSSSVICPIAWICSIRLRIWAETCTSGVAAEARGLHWLLPLPIPRPSPGVNLAAMALPPDANVGTSESDANVLVRVRLPWIEEAPISSASPSCTASSVGSIAR